MTTMTDARAAHAPVLLEEALALAAPVRGVWLDGTFGAGGYARGLLDAGAERVIALDRDPTALAAAADWAPAYGDRLTLIEGRFGDLDRHADAPLAGVALDIGVSSMQIDRPERGFSFQTDGPLDMRMERDGPSAADLVNRASEADLADILFQYGEERASRRIARRIVERRAGAPLVGTAELVEVIEKALPRPRPGQPHRATRSFQALRIAVNDELGELIRALEAAERALAPGGVLIVVTFHSLEDRIVKRFIAQRSAAAAGGSRHAPEPARMRPRFERVTRRAVVPGAAEIARNPRARSAKLRAARRTAAPAGPADRATIGAPRLDRDRIFARLGP